MGRIKIKHENSDDKIYKIKLLQILSINNIYATKIFNAHDGFVVLTNSDEDVENIISKNVAKELKEADFDPITPPELKAKRSVILLKVDDHIYSNEKNKIKEEIAEHNDYITLEDIEDIIKFPKSNTIKLIFQQSSTAKKARNAGIKLFSMSIPHHQIKEEIFVNINTCMKCYVMEDHYTSQCPKPKEFQICSECGEDDHTWQRCKNETKKCINCKGDHRTLAMSCPQRKELITQKRKNNEQKEKGQVTYSQSVGANSTVMMHAPANITPKIEKDTATKLLACMMHSHLINIAKPGSYNTEMNKVLKLNNLPAIILPDNPPSSEIITKAKIINESPEENVEVNTMEEEEIMTVNKNTKEKEAEDINRSEIEKIPQLEQINGAELGLNIVTSESEGWPKTTLTAKHITKGLLQCKYKWIYTNNKYSEGELLRLLNNNEINLNNCFRTVEDQIFRKIRNGFIQEKTPPAGKDRIRKLSK